MSANAHPTCLYKGKRDRAGKACEVRSFQPFNLSGILEEEVPAVIEYGERHQEQQESHAEGLGTFHKG